jgi:hypothetical protein
MLVPAEQRLLYRLTSHYYSGAGVIVDAGAFCGASAYAMAAGFSDNTGIFSKERRIHSYDLFVADDEYTRDYLQNNFYTRFDRHGKQVELIRRVASGESFLDIFLFQTQRYENLVEVHPGSILAQKWSGGKIEILFLDICKTLEIQRHVFAEFLPHLIPGRSIVIQQDFHHAWHPYIHVAMEYLDPYFDIIVPAIGGSRVYRLHSPVPQHALEKSIRYEFTEEETVHFLGQMVQKALPGERRILSAVLARQLFLVGDVERCRNIIIRTLAELQGPGRANFESLFGGLCPGVYKSDGLTG